MREEIVNHMLLFKKQNFSCGNVLNLDFLQGSVQPVVDLTEAFQMFCEHGPLLITRFEVHRDYMEGCLQKSPKGPVIQIHSMVVVGMNQDMKVCYVFQNILVLF